MWLRNLLFLGLIGSAVVALGANLIPPAEPRLLTHHDTAAYQADDFRSSVSAVDASFRRQWQEQNLKPTGPAPDLAIARRLALGLMGTVPSLEEIRQFDALPSEERLAWWLDRILQDRRSADYLAERLARAYVGVEGGQLILYRRRRFVTWLSDQLARNRSYDSLVRELITARGLWTDHPGTNFLTVTVQTDSKGQPDPVRLAGRVTRAFLGLRLDCAQCHNHPFAEWKQSDFQSLAAFFAQAHVGFIGIYDGEGEFQPEDRKTREKKVVYPSAPFAKELFTEQGTRRERLAAWVTHAKNPYFAKAIVNRVWALMLGRPLAEPVDNLETDTAPPPALGILANDLAAHGFDLRRLVRVIAATEVFRLDSRTEDDREITESDEKAWAVFPLTRLRPEQVAGGALQAAVVTTVNSESDFFTRLGRFGNQNDFVTRYGDTGEDDFEGRGGTIPQRLLMMNGALIHDRIKDDMGNASTRIAWQAPNNSRAIEVAYLAVLTRRPTPAEAKYWEQFLTQSDLKPTQRLEDIYWTLLNSTEFSWNH
jgi:hypothetical protein